MIPFLTAKATADARVFSVKQRYFFSPIDPLYLGALHIAATEMIVQFYSSKEGVYLPDKRISFLSQAVVLL
jgi:hypothetical protein